MQKGQTFIFILLGMVIAAFVGMAFYMGKITPKPPPEVVTLTPSPIPSPSPVDASPAPTGAGETANWKEYTNPDKKFTFKYPPDLHIKELPLGKHWRTDEKEISKVALLTQYDSADYKRTGLEDSNKIFTLTITVTESTKHLTNTDLKAKLLEPPSTQGPEAKAVSEKVKNSLKDYKNGQINGLYFMDGWDYDYKNIEMAKLDNLYFFFFSGDQGTQISKYGEDIISQILHTFKFLK